MCRNINGVNKCAAVLLQDILQAALHVETDLEQHPMSTGTSLVTAVPLINADTVVRPKNAEQLPGGHDSVAVTKMSDARLQCRDRATDTVKADVDPASVFCLSHDDFGEDMDDLSFIDIPQHSEISRCLKSVAVTADSQQASKNKSSSSSAVADVSSRNHCLQTANNCILESCDVSSAMSNQNVGQSFAGNIDFHQHDSGKYILKCLLSILRIMS